MAWASHWAPGAGAGDLRATLHPLGGLWGHPSPVSRRRGLSGVPAARNHCGGADLAVGLTTVAQTTRTFRVADDCPGDVLVRGRRSALGLLWAGAGHQPIPIAGGRRIPALLSLVHGRPGELPLCPADERTADQILARCRHRTAGWVDGHLVFCPGSPRRCGACRPAAYVAVLRLSDW